MPSIEIRIAAMDDPPIWPDLEKLRGEGGLIHLPDATLQLGVLEGGMQSGECSVALRIPLPNGQVVIVETSAAIWKASGQAVEVAEKRFKHGA